MTSVKTKPGFLIRLVILIVLVGTLPMSVVSASAAAAQKSVFEEMQEIFDNGKASFKQQAYADAVKLFRQAEAKGMESPALFYNLASSYYMLGDYDNSAVYFNKVRRYPEMQDIAEYNLGLIAMGQDDHAAAEKWFGSVLANSKDKKLVYLAEKKINDIAALKKTDWTSERWTAYVTAALGYDDNVNFAPLGITAEKADSFYEIYAMADFLLEGDRKNGWLAEVSFYDMNFQTEDLYDETEYAAAIKKNLQISRDWQTYYTLDITKLDYNQADYQTITGVMAESRYWLSNDGNLMLRYGYEDINSDDALYDYLEGWRQRIRAGYSIYHRQDYSRFYYELELNDRNDLTIDQGTFSYSPTRHLFAAKHTSVLNQYWHVTGELSYRVSDYPATDIQDRNDDRIKAAIYVDYRFNKDIKLRARTVYTDNSSTDDLYDYKQTVYTVGLHAYF